MTRHKKSVVTQLQGIRYAEGATIGDLARKLGISRDELIGIESGSVEVGEWFVDVYCDALGVGDRTIR